MLKVRSTRARVLRTGSFRESKSKWRYWLIFLALVVLSILFTYLLLSYKNPAEPGTEQFWRIAKRRSDQIIAIGLTALCQAVGTVAFQTVANNRIITPSIMGFDALYRVIHTSTVFFFGVAGMVAADSLGMFGIQIVLMVGLSLVLYGWLLTGKRGNMHVMLLVGIILGGGLGSVATFMQRLLTPTEFDVLTSRLYGSVANADRDYFPTAISLCFVAVFIIILLIKKLNVVALGKDIATNLGVNHKAVTITVLVAVSVLIAVSTALVGPMVFLGFLAATLGYQFCDSYDHRYILPMTVAIAYTILTAAYFIMNYVIYSEGVVSIIIEMAGGVVFLIVLLRKGRL